MKNLLTALAVAAATLTATASTALAENKPIFINNLCYDTIENLVIRHRTTSDDSWHSHGFWTISPWKETFITDTDDSKYYHDTSKTLYIYAEQKNSSRRWAGDNEQTYRGIIYPFKKVTQNEYPDRIEVRLSCD